MEVNRNSWHYRFIHNFWGFKEKPNENLCGYFCKLAGLLLVMCLILPMVLGIYCIAWFFGYWPNYGKYKENNHDSPFHSKINFDGRRVWPVAPIVVVIALAFIVGLIYSGVALNILLTLAVINVIIIGGFAASTVLIILLVKGWKTEACRLCRGYLSIRKKKVCLPITFVGDLPER